MKNLFIYSGIALVVLVNSTKMPFDIKKEIGFYQDSKKEMIVSKDIKTVLSEDYSSNSEKVSSSKGAAVLKSKTLLLRYFPKTTVKKTIAEDEPIEVVSTTKMNKTADELIAQDNLITEKNISNETQALDFDIINGNEVVESANISKTEKTVNQLFAEDNAITENNISNETQDLDFDVINGNEVVEAANISKIEKTVDQLFAMDNAITEKNISNATQALDFDIINGNEVVEWVSTFKTEKNAYQLFAEDNLITENNISNETQSLDFEIINKIAKPRN